MGALAMADLAARRTAGGRGCDPLPGCRYPRPPQAPMFLGGLHMVVLLLGGCGVDVPEVPQEATSDGESCTIDIRLASTLGAEDDAASVVSGQGVDVAWIPEMGWIVVDFPNDVFSYDPSGRFQGRLGRQGAGPEEWSEPARVAVDESDSLWVSDLRGRAVVFTPEGAPARTLAGPHLVPIEGFLEGGRPYSVLFRPSPSDRSEGTLLAQVWSREHGERRETVGPGALGEHGATVPMLVPPGTAPVGSDLYASVGASRWLVRWTSGGEDTVATSEAVLAGLEKAGIPGPVEEAHPVAVTASEDGGFWVVGSLRRMGVEEEEALREAAGLASGVPSGSLELARSPAIRNRVFDGILVHLSEDGEVTDAVIFDPVPLGFVANAEQYFALVQSDAGLLKLQIWSFQRQCDRHDEVESEPRTGRRGHDGGDGLFEPK